MEIVQEHAYGLLALFVATFALFIRLVPRDGMQYMQALDPYVISRMAESIVSEGSLVAIDVWRYFPFTYPVNLMNLGDIVIPAYLYKIAGAYGMDFITWTQVYPALLGAGMVLVMYFIGKELFDRQAGLFAAFFLAASPAVLHRSSAGWFEKEPIGGLFMFLSIYFITRAWKRNSWNAGIISGISLSIALMGWGGSRFLVLLYPLIAFMVAFIDEDIEQLIAAFTPTLIIGHVLAATLNPQRWDVAGKFALFGYGVLGLLWTRYLLVEYEVVDQAYSKYLVPGMTAVGGVLLFLSPLYSQWLAGTVNSLIRTAMRSGGAVVAGTVAENRPAQGGQIIGQLGVGQISRMDQFQMFYPVAELFSGWTFSIIGTSALLTVLLYMLVTKYDVVEDVEAKWSYFAFIGTTIFVSVALMVLLPEGAGTAFVFPLIIAIVGALFMVVFADERTINIEPRWYLIIPLLWSVTTLFGATRQSRLLFLTSQPIALLAGYGLSVSIDQLREATVWDRVLERTDEIGRTGLLMIVVILVLAPIVTFNAAAAYGMADSIGGSPNQAWMENLDFMRENTPVDSVVLSWWDYGYWFETIGARAAIADGGNAQFYNDAPGFEHKIINMPLADFLTSSDYTEWLDWLNRYSVDYVTLDSTMIGKYSAVSTIHHRGEQTDAMRTLSLSGRQQANGKQYLVYQSRGAQFYVPVQRNGNSISINGQPLLRQQGQTAPVTKFCTSNGVVEFNVEEGGAVNGCLAWHPYYGQQRLIYIPENVMDSTLVRLYIMDAHNMPHFEEVFNNGYVKMWKVNYDATAQAQ